MRPTPIGKDQVNHYFVSTVFLGEDYQPRPYERTGGWNPAVEGYDPPRCVTESQMLVEALERISALEAQVASLLSGRGFKWHKI